MSRSWRRNCAQAQRRAFLTDPTHKHVFHFTPTHGSWLNQVELWFSVLARRFLKRGDFSSMADFEARLLAFLEDYNRRHAHPYSLDLYRDTAGSRDPVQSNPSPTTAGTCLVQPTAATVSTRTLSSKAV